MECAFIKRAFHPASHQGDGSLPAAVTVVWTGAISVSVSIRTRAIRSAIIAVVGIRSGRDRAADETANSRAKSRCAGAAVTIMMIGVMTVTIIMVNRRCGGAYGDAACEDGGEPNPGCFH